MCLDTLHKGDDDVIMMMMIKAKVIPVIIWATGTISNSLRQYLMNIPGKQEIKELHVKISCIGHCTHTMESVNSQVLNIFHG